MSSLRKFAAKAWDLVLKGLSPTDADDRPDEVTWDHALSAAGPEPFGYKTAWFAVPTMHTRALCEALGLTSLTEVGWDEGLPAAHKGAIRQGIVHGPVFVTPPLGTWTLVVGVSLIRFGDDAPEGDLFGTLERLSDVFGSAQYFATHSVSESHFWARADRGRLRRAYCTADEGTQFEVGEQTREERQLGFAFFNPSDAKDDSYWDRKDLTFADEECVMRLARLWSLAPVDFRAERGPAGLGLLAELGS